MKCSELRSTENLDFSRPRSYNGLKRGEVFLPVANGPRKEAVVDE